MSRSAVSFGLASLRVEHLEGRVGGITAVCSAHPFTLECALASAAAEGSMLLIEATANQVNQFGGYTGMRPKDFAAQVRKLCRAAGLARRQVFIGADHLGPHPWRNQSARQALDRAAALAAEFAAAGFQKLHLDTGIACADDPGAGVPPEIAAERAVTLCHAVEAAAGRRAGGRPRPLYVIGAEVPLPGGALEGAAMPAVTAPEAVMEIVSTAKEHFRQAGLEEAWERVMAVVVQPGVEFGDLRVARYQPQKAAALSAFHAHLPGIMTYEVHAADYQLPAAATQLVRDHFTVLKVGPCLTNAFREAVFSLAHIETEWLGKRRGVTLSRMRQVLEKAMLVRPDHWRSHYRGSEAEVRYLRSYSLRDRIRYYWSAPAVTQALAQLLANLAPPVPTALVRQYFPELFPALDRGELAPDPRELIRGRIEAALTPYLQACRQADQPRSASSGT